MSGIDFYILEGFLCIVWYMVSESGPRGYGQDIPGGHYSSQ